jgi:hypothetical protein
MYHVYFHMNTHESYIFIYLPNLSREKVISEYAISLLSKGEIKMSKKQSENMDLISELILENHPSYIYKAYHGEY